MRSWFQPVLALVPVAAARRNKFEIDLTCMFDMLVAEPGVYKGNLVLNKVNHYKEVRVCAREPALLNCKAV